MAQTLKGAQKNQYKITSACVDKQETGYDHKIMKYMKANEDKNVNMVNIKMFFVSCGLSETTRNPLSNSMRSKSCF